MKKPEEEFELHLRPRAVETVSIQIPTDALASLKKVAASRDMSYQALLKLYIGQGLRQDLARLFSDRVLETTASSRTAYPIGRKSLGHYSGNSSRSSYLSPTQAQAENVRTANTRLPTTPRTANTSLQRTR